MRKITRQIVWLFVVFVVYFGYSAFIDGVALYHLKIGMTVYNGDLYVGKFSSGLLMGTAGWSQTRIFFENHQFLLPPNFHAVLDNGQTITGNISAHIGGFMAPNSLSYTILTPFKLVLLGAVFASLIPLFKSIFLGTFLGIKNYLKNRRPNILFNYEKAIHYTETLKTKLEEGNYEQIKAQYGAFDNLTFRPVYLKTMMEEIADYLIRQRDTKIFINPSQVIINSLVEMYDKERKTAQDGKPVEWFFDLRMGYDYTSVGSKYNIAYYKALSVRKISPVYLAWKLFSLEMFRFFLYVLLAIIPTIILNVIILPLVGKSASSFVTSQTAPATVIMSLFIISIILHACFTLTQKQYRHMKYIWLPAIVYYLLVLWFGVSLVIGINSIQSVGATYIPGTAIALMWPFFAALGYTILSSCLILYIISILMDDLPNPDGLNTKDIVNGLVLPAVFWCAATAIHFTGILGKKNLSLYSGIAVALVAGFWVYLTIADILANNLIRPTKKDAFPFPKARDQQPILN